MAVDPHLAELERILKRDERGRTVASSFAAQKLQPKELPPPPDDLHLAADDLDPLSVDEARPKLGLFLGAAVLVALLAAGGLWAMWPARDAVIHPPVAMIPPPALPPQQGDTAPRAVPAPPPVTAVEQPPPATPPVASRPPPVVTPPAMASAPISTAPLPQAVELPPPLSPAQPPLRAEPSVRDASAALDLFAALVPPDTAGLTPARKVRATIILVDGDTERKAESAR
jgi:hypothetical protein